MVTTVATRALRLVAAAFVAGAAGGAAAGLGARCVMFLLRVANPAFNGSTTHEGFVNGQWTVAGTVNLVVQGLFFGIVGGVLYVLVRSLLVGPTPARGALFGIVLLAIGGSAILDGNYEYSRFVSTWVSVSAFASLYVLYGVVVAVVADAVARRLPPSHQPWRRLARRAASAALLVGVALAAVQLVQDLRFRYGF